MKVLDLKDNRVIVSPEALALSFFSDLWSRDKTSTKTKAYNDIAYIFFMCDFNSPYNSYPEEERASYIKEYVVGKDYKPDSKVLLGIEKYKEINLTPSMKLLEAANVAISKTKDYLNGVDYTKMDSNGRFIYDIDKVSKLIISMPKMQEALNQAKEICLKEKSGTNRNKAGYSTGLFEE